MTGNLLPREPQRVLRVTRSSSTLDPLVRNSIDGGEIYKPYNSYSIIYAQALMFVAAAECWGGLEPTVHARLIRTHVRQSLRFYI
jgi:hypothetical protein